MTTQQEAQAMEKVQPTRALTPFEESRNRVKNVRSRLDAPPSVGMKPSSPNCLGFSGKETPKVDAIERNDEFLKWHPNFETGQDKIDQHHQYTFHLANLLHNAGKAHDHARARNIIETYLKHLKVHCAYEETLLRDARRHNELEQLSRVHRALIEKAETAFQQVVEGQLSTEHYFYNMIIINDIVNHQMEEDRALFHIKPDKHI
ncbi:MAG: hypothetical protein PHG47_11445 [Sulfuricella sp.]|nr:hypothetical protein [Sulfuricella sp.]